MITGHDNWFCMRNNLARATMVIRHRVVLLRQIRSETNSKMQNDQVKGKTVDSAECECCETWGKEQCKVNVTLSCSPNGSRFISRTFLELQSFSLIFASSRVDILFRLFHSLVKFYSAFNSVGNKRERTELSDLWWRSVLLFTHLELVSQADIITDVDCRWLKHRASVSCAFAWTEPEHFKTLITIHLIQVWNCQSQWTWMQYPRTRHIPSMQSRQMQVTFERNMSY